MNDKEMKIWTYEEVSAPHLWMTRAATFMPLENRNFDFIGTRLHSMYCHIMVFIYNTTYLWSSIKMFVDPNLEFDLTLVCEAVVVQSISIKYAIAILNRERFTGLMETCRKLWRHVQPEESGFVKGFEKKAYVLRNIFLGNGVITTAVYVMTAFFVRLPPLEPNGTERRMLPLRFYVDVQEEPMFTIVSILLSVVCFTIAMPVIPALETTSLYSIMMACGYLRCIDNRLRAIKDKALVDEYSFSKKDIVRCVIFHQEVLRYCEDIEKFTRSIFMTTVMSILYILSLIMLKLLQGDSSMYNLLAVFALHSVSLFVCQWGPQQLTNESERIANAAYSAALEQRNFEREANNILSLVMMRAQKPIQLTAGGYIKLSMETFQSMATSAMSFFTVLRSF